MSYIYVTNPAIPVLSFSIFICGYTETHDCGQFATLIVAALTEQKLTLCIAKPQ